MFWIFGWLFVIIVLLTVAGMIFAWVKDRGYYSSCDYSSLFVNSFFVLLITFCVWISMAIWTSGDHRLDDYNEQSVVSNTTPIKSASLNSELSGSFFLGIGAIDNEDVYKFYEIVSESSYKLMSLPVKNTRIQEVDVDSTFVPHVTSYYYTEGYTRHCWFVRAMLNKEEKEYSQDIHHLKEHVIYVPKGTIVDDFSKLNLHN